MDVKIRVNLAGKTINCLFFIDMRSRDVIGKSENSFLTVNMNMVKYFNFKK